jgi:hypothetical protein
MPQILVTADRPDDPGAAVLLRERISMLDLESEHFSARLLERLGWALVDADELEHSPAAAGAPPRAARPSSTRGCAV